MAGASPVGASDRGNKTTNADNIEEGVSDGGATMGGAPPWGASARAGARSLCPRNSGDLLEGASPYDAHWVEHEFGIGNDVGLPRMGLFVPCLRE